MPEASHLRPYARLASMYDELLGPDFADVQRAFEWVERRYGVRFDSAVDVGCGTGTFVAYLCGRAVGTVWGVDISPEMLDQAGTKNAGSRARFLLQDMRELNLPRPVQLLTCQFEALNYLPSTEDLRLTMAAFARALEPGGYAVFDLVTSRPGEKGIGPRLELARDADRTVTLRTRYDADQRMQTASVRFANSAGIDRETHLQRAHSVADVGAALDGTGLHLVAVHDFADLVGGSAERAERAIILARRFPAQDAATARASAT